MPSITINRGGPAADIEDGVYAVVLAAVNGPKTIYPPNAPDGTDIFEWEFLVEGSDQQIQGTTSTASGPKSKMYGWLTALLGGKPPAPGEQIDTDSLVGKRALATINHNDAGWPRIEQLTAIPAQMLQQQFAAATGAPTRPQAASTAPRPAASRPAARPQPVTAVAGDDLPF